MTQCPYYRSDGGIGWWRCDIMQDHGETGHREPPNFNAGGGVAVGNWVKR